MKKILRNLAFRAAAAFALSHILVKAAYALYGDKLFYLGETVLAASLVFIVFYGLFYSLAWSTCKPVAQFIESESNSIPKFGSTELKEISHEGVDGGIERFVARIDEHFVVSRLDVENQFIKCFQQPTFTSWGLAYVIKVEDQKLLIHSFPFIGDLGVRRLRKKGLDQIEACIPYF
ncbi:hypothetical protein [Carboxylicivirga sp. M1479]|uniref:hypothetical protein n=1 Tax=Carboxylicivirga sp. M1479 TaxID=2594476 RepID=UPI0011786680|nr:hypothetical protein [Carboxylicivirga sp. M1479]TRX72033.1 hypothetical protein FNN09_03235 [Carboxylicivirga sp. M1479]